VSEDKSETVGAVAGAGVMIIGGFTSLLILIFGFAMAVAILF